MLPETIDILGIVLFLFCLWGSGKMAVLIHVSPMVFEVLVGIALGPPGFNVVPLFTEGIVSIWQIAGQIGIALLLFESGIKMEMQEMKGVGCRAILVGVVGMCIPIGLCILLAGLLYDLFPDTLSAAMVLAPTSVAVSVQLLSEVRLLQCRPGQTICCAAFVDDVLSLILLAVLSTITNASSSAWNIVKAICFSFLFLAIGGFLADRVAAKAIAFIVKKAATVLNDRTDEIHLFLMLCVLVIYSTIGAIIGSSLLGCFLAGINFSTTKRSGRIWDQQLKRISKWLIKFFFGATIAFIVPLSDLMSWSSLWQGIVVALIPTLLGKIVAGVVCAEKGDGLLVGAAMCGRGELAFVIAETARNQLYTNGDKQLPLLSPRLFSIVTWALLWSIVATPLIFRFALHRYLRDNQFAIDVGIFSEAQVAVQTTGGNPNLNELFSLEQRNKWHMKHFSFRQEHDSMYLKLVVGNPRENLSQRDVDFLEDFVRDTFEDDASIIVSPECINVDLTKCTIVVIADSCEELSQRLEQLKSLVKFLKVVKEGFEAVVECEYEGTVVPELPWTFCKVLDETVVV